MLANMMAGFPAVGAINNPNISDIEGCEKLLKSANWNTNNLLPIYGGNNKLCQTFYFDFESIQTEIGNFISCAAGIRGAVWTDSPHYGAYKISFC